MENEKPTVALPELQRSEGQTPRTDDVLESAKKSWGEPTKGPHPVETILLNHARQLERERNYYERLAQYIEGCHTSEQAERKRLEALTTASASGSSELADVLDQRVRRDSYDRDEAGVLVRLSELPLITAALRAVSTTGRNEWEDRYRREVLGENNEGDYIAGVPGGLRYDLAMARAEVEKKQGMLTHIGNLLNEQTYTAAVIKIISDEALARNATARSAKQASHLPDSKSGTLEIKPK